MDTDAKLAQLASGDPVIVATPEEGKTLIRAAANPDAFLLDVTDEGEWMVRYRDRRTEEDEDDRRR